MAGQAPAAERPATIEEVITGLAKQHGVPPALALAVARRESGIDQSAVGDSGKAVGIFQLHPGAAQDTGVADRSDPIQNITGGVKYLKQLSDRYKGDVHKTLMAYNGGMGNVDAGTISPDAQAYAADVLAELSGGIRKRAMAGPAMPAAAQRGMTPPSTPGYDPPAQPLVTPQAADPAQPGMLQAGAQALIAGVDPRTTEGRIGLAATAASIGAGALTGGVGALPWVVRILAAPTAAAVGGGTTAAIEQQLGSAPDSMDPMMEGAKQGAYEMGGQLLMWPVRRVGSAFLASRIGKQATETLSQAAVTAREAGRAAVETAKERVLAGVEAAKLLARTHMNVTRRSAASTVRTARRQAGEVVSVAQRAATAQEDAIRKQAQELVARTELDNAAQLDDLAKQYDNLLGAPPSVTAAGDLTREALQGPAKRALDMAGQRVNEAAQSGPMITITPLQAAVDELASKYRPAALFPAKETPKGIGFLQNVAPRAAGAAAGQRMSREEFQKAIAGQLGVDQTHPLPGILGQLQDVKLEQLPFADVHRLKMLLDEAVNWDRTAKKHLEKVTKGVRIAVRDALSDHEPYNVATAAYQAIVPLYRRGVGKTVMTAAVNNPDAIARTLNVKNPGQAQALKDLVVTQSAAGGDAKTGLQAWDAIRSAFTYDHIVKGGIDGLSDRVHRVVEQSPEFARVVFDDDASQRILSNFDRLGQAYQFAKEQTAANLSGAKAVGKEAIATAQTRGAEGIAAAKGSGRVQVDTARQAATEAVQRARETATRGVGAVQQRGRAAVRTAAREARAAVQDVRAEQAKLAASSIKGGSLEGQMANMMRAAMLGPKGSLWGALSLIRLLQGPKAQDLLQWAAYSDRNTQRMVSVLTGQAPDRVFAGVLREAMMALNPPAEAPPTQ